MHILLETDHLILRRFTEDDADALFELDSDPAVMRWLSGGAPTPREVIETEILPRFMRYDQGAPGLGFWAAVEKASGAFVGWFCLRAVEGAPGVAALGYRLRKVVWGQGYATEGARALIHKGFNQLGLQRVVATTYQDNLASRRVLEKLGLRLVRRFRLTVEELTEIDTFQAGSSEPWDGEDLEYALDRADWMQQEASAR
ncbi:MAG: GNAT family N-acetyltransferase [Anaerolineae bacterium]|nr:GNAT family N-acetyltransferase [Anaerolineae bacterium]